MQSEGSPDLMDVINSTRAVMSSYRCFLIGHGLFCVNPANFRLLTLYCYKVLQKKYIFSFDVYKCNLSN